MTKTDSGYRRNPKKLVEDLLQGDNATWKYLYNATWPKISGYVMAQGGSDDDAKEVHQVALIVLYKKLYALTVSVETFAFAVAKYSWWQMNKKKGKHIPYEPNPVYNGEDDDDNDPLDGLSFIGSDGIENPFDSSDLPSIDEVLDYIKTMGNPCSDLLLDHYIGKISYGEMAEEIKGKPGTIRQQASRCLEKVRKHFLELIKTSN